MPFPRFKNEFCWNSLKIEFLIEITFLNYISIIRYTPSRGYIKIRLLELNQFISSNFFLLKEMSDSFSWSEEVFRWIKETVFRYSARILHINWWYQKKACKGNNSSGRAQILALMFFFVRLNVPLLLYAQAG